MTSKEPMEPIDEEAGDIVDLEDVSEFKHANCWETGPSGWDVNRMIEGPVVTSPTDWKGHICEYVPKSPLGIYV